MTPKQKSEFLDQSRKHFEADMLIKGVYGCGCDQMTRFVFAIDTTVWGLPFALDISPEMGEASFLCFLLHGGSVMHWESKMKVFVVASGYDYEGFGAPDGVYETLEEAVSVALALDDGDYRCVFEYELGGPNYETVWSYRKGCL